MAVRNDFTAGEVLAAADLNDTFAAKLNLAGGKVLQIVRATDTTDRVTTSTSFVDVTGMSVTITPQKSNSAILLILSAVILTQQTGNDPYGFVRITDSSNNAISGSQNLLIGGQGTTAVSPPGISYAYNPTTITAYSTPATLSAVTYKVQFRVDSGRTITFSNSTFATGQLYAIEVSA